MASMSNFVFLFCFFFGGGFFGFSYKYHEKAIMTFLFRKLKQQLKPFTNNLNITKENQNKDKHF